MAERLLLIVEDEPAQRDLLTRLLSMRGWSVKTAADLVQA